MKAKVIRWMKQWVSDYVDESTGEVNCTALGESAAHEFNMYERDSNGVMGDINEDAFAWAVDVAEWYESR